MYGKHSSPCCSGLNLHISLRQAAEAMHHSSLPGTEGNSNGGMQGNTLSSFFHDFVRRRRALGSRSGVLVNVKRMEVTISVLRGLEQKEGRDWSRLKRNSRSVVFPKVYTA